MVQQVQLQGWRVKEAAAPVRNGALTAGSTARITFAANNVNQFNTLIVSNTSSTVPIEIYLNGDVTRMYTLAPGQPMVLSPPTDKESFLYLDIKNIHASTQLAAAAITFVAQWLEQGI